jgi:hypothetical protein
MYRKVQAYSQTRRSGQPDRARQSFYQAIPSYTVKNVTSDPRRQLGILGDVTD